MTVPLKFFNCPTAFSPIRSKTAASPLPITLEDLITFIAVSKALVEFTTTFAVLAVAFTTPFTALSATGPPTSSCAISPAASPAISPRRWPSSQVLNSLYRDLAA